MENGQSVFFLSPHTPVGRVRLACFAHVRLLRHALPISLLILRKKNRLFYSLRNFLPPLRETYVAAYSSRFNFFSVLFLVLSQETYIGLLFIEKEEYKSLFVTLTTSTGTENNLMSPIAGFQCHAIPIRSK